MISARTIWGHFPCCQNMERLFGTYSGICARHIPLSSLSQTQTVFCLLPMVSQRYITRVKWERIADRERKKRFLNPCFSPNISWTAIRQLCRVYINWSRVLYPEVCNAFRESNFKTIVKVTKRSWRLPLATWVLGVSLGISSGLLVGSSVIPSLLGPSLLGMMVLRLNPTLRRVAIENLKRWGLWNWLRVWVRVARGRLWNWLRLRAK